jgi:peptidoglycan/LPS O-acetylase OafA/YrhL
MTERRPGDSASRIGILDGFRAFAILSVLAFHYTIRWAAPADVPPHIPTASPFVGFLPFEYGWMGVELFFVVSGFVILMTLKRCRGPLDFAQRRVARLWPVLAVAAALSTVIVNRLGPPDWSVSLVDYAASLAVVDPHLLAWAGVDAHWVDGAYWSLWVELRFYIVIAAFYFCCGRKFLKAWLAFQALAALASFLAPGRLVEMIAFPELLPYFTIGICTFELWSGAREAKLAVAGAILAGALILNDSALAQGLFAGRPAVFSVAANLLIFGLFALFLIDHPILKPFASKPAVALGQASYSLYLIHENVGVALLRQLSAIPFVAALGLVVAACVALSLALFRWVEMPARAWLTRAVFRRPIAILRHVPDGL